MALAPNPLNAYPNTGLAQLGDTLLRGTGDYANIQLRKQREEEHRRQQLEDLANAKLYAGEQFDKQRNLQVGDRDLLRTQQLGDVETARKARLADAGSLATMNTRFDALKRAMELGLIAQNDIGKMAIEDAALLKLQERELKETERMIRDRERAQKRVDANAIKEAKIEKEIAEDDRIASSVPQVNQRELLVTQERLAKALKPKGETVTDEDIDAQFEAAKEIYKKEAFEKHYERVQQAKISAQNNRYLLQGIRQENNQMNQRYGVVSDVPSATLSDPVTAGATPRAAPVDPSAGFMAAFEEERRKRNPQPPPSPGAALANPMNDPALLAYAAEDPSSLTPQQARTNELAQLLGQRDSSREARARLAPALMAPPLSGLTDTSMFPVAQAPAPVSRPSIASALSAAGVDEANAAAAYRNLLMKFAPKSPGAPAVAPQRALAPLPWQPAKTPASVFSNTFGFLGV